MIESTNWNIEFRPSPRFVKKSLKLLNKNRQLKTKISKILLKLQNNPFDISLRTHKVSTILGDIAFSSRITGDLRLIWDFDGENINIIDLLDIGGHSGSNQVYALKS